MKQKCFFFFFKIKKDYRQQISENKLFTFRKHLYMCHGRMGDGRIEILQELFLCIHQDFVSVTEG